MFIPFIIFGIAMIAMGIYVLITKNVFGKYDPWPSIVKALNLSENGVKIISIVFGILYILIGLYFFIHSVLSPDPFSAFWFIYT